MSTNPPGSALRFLRWICPPYLLEEIEGDLHQRFRRDVEKFGLRKARVKFVWNAFRFFRAGILLRNRFSLNIIPLCMLLNYITIAFRNFRRQKSYTLLNVIGLSLGMAASIPGKENYWTRGVKRLSGGPEGNLLVTHVALDHEHVPQYEIRVVAGRNFDKRFPADDKKVLINESLSAALHFKEPALAIGEQVRTGR